MKRNPESWMVDFRETPKWNYTQGLMMTAILKLWEKSRNQSYFDYAKSFADTLIGADGRIGGDYEITAFNIDHVKPGRPLLRIYEATGDERYLKAIKTLRTQLEWQPRTTDGGFWHKLRYPWQMWLDGLYMGEPFYAEYAGKFDEPAAFDDIARQFILMEKHARDEKTGLLHHGWDESRLQQWSDPVTGKSECFWGRAVGWYLMALVDVLDHFPQEHPQRAEILAILGRTAEAVAKYQDNETGLWYQVLDQGQRKGNYLEATASIMFAYALAKGANENYLPMPYLQVAQKGYEGVIEHLVEVDDDGEVHIRQCCAVAGLGGYPYRSGTYDYYVNEEIRMDDPKATGPFILASLEFER
jgi:unsaturated rhamnogalacturonyl hydrolase